jgi:hypothetical protein
MPSTTVRKRVPHLPPSLRRLACAGAAAGLLSLAAFGGARAPAQNRGGALPFAPGEELHFRGSSPRLGSFGRATMKVVGGQEVRGRQAYELSFDFDGRVGIFGVHDRTRSWVTPHGMTSLRYRKDERSPISARHQAVEIMPEERRWQDAAGEHGTLPTDQPQDELSFLYLLRTLPLADSATYRVDRHYDAARNPVVVKVLARGPVTVPAGRFEGVQVEMRVKDPARYRGQQAGVVRIWMTDDERRIPLSIESTFPVAGQVTLQLVSGAGP